MPKIIQLSPHIANLIAAGEVVERPASVAKELLENAVDAGASKITIEIKDGGMTYLRLTDNGCGMSAEDARTAFLRHATSKLRAAEDLAAIHVLGYIGSYDIGRLVLCFIQYLPAGLCLAWTYTKADNIAAPMVVHAIVNAVAIGALR